MNKTANSPSVEQIAERYVADGKSAGMVTLVCWHGEIVHRHCAGHTDIGNGRPIRDDTVFRTYLMTKPLTNVLEADNNGDGVANRSELTTYTYRPISDGVFLFAERLKMADCSSLAIAHKGPLSIIQRRSKVTDN